MTVSFIAAATANDGQTATATAMSSTIPATAAIGDYGLFMLCENTGASGNVFTAPSGWTALSANNFVATTMQSQVFHKDLVSGDPGLSVSWSTSAANSGRRFIGLMLVFRGTSGAANVTIGTPTLTAAATTTLVEPTITTTVDNSYVVGFWGTRVATAAPGPTITYPGTETFDGRTRTAFTASPNYAIEGSHLTTTGVAGSYGGTSATASASTTDQHLYVVTIPPAVSAAVTQQKLISNRAAIRRASTW